MAGSSIETMILFIAALVVAAGVAGTLASEVSRVSDAIDDQGLEVSEEIRTDIEIVSDAGSPGEVYDDNGNKNITIYVKNTGSSSLPAESDQIEVLVNGTFVTDVGVTVVDGSEWEPGNVVELEIDQALGSGQDHRVKVVVNGDEEVFEFRT